MVEQLDITLEHQLSAVTLFCHDTHVATTYTTLSGHSIRRYRKFCTYLHPSQVVEPLPPRTADKSMAEWAVEHMCYNPGILVYGVRRSRAGTLSNVQ